MHHHCFSKGGLMAGRISVIGGEGENLLVKMQIFRPTSHLLDKWVNISVAASQNVHFKSLWVIFVLSELGEPSGLSDQLKEN